MGKSGGGGGRDSAARAAVAPKMKPDAGPVPVNAEAAAKTPLQRGLGRIKARATAKAKA